MTKEQKSKYEGIGIATFIILLFAFGGWLTLVKADRTELIPIKDEVKEICSEQKEQRELYHRLDRTLGRIEVILEKWEDK
jgi:hypothetical protein